LLACLLAVVMHWPLVLNLDGQVERDIGDPLVQSWQVAWGGHALVEQPLEYFQANMFYPESDSLAFSEALAGYAPAGLIGDGVGAAIARYNVLFLFAYALAFFGAYLLARELGLSPAAAVVAGAAFAYAPWRLEQDGHLHVLSSGGIPLCLFFLVRGYRELRWGLVLAGWLVAAWQVSLGFTLGLQLGYLLLALGVAWGVWWWRRRPRPTVPRPLLAATVAGALIAAVTAVALARPYQRVLDEHPEAHRTSEKVSQMSGPLWQFVAAPEENLVWGELTKGVRDELSSRPEQTLLPGVVILALALLGVFGTTLSRRVRLGLGLAVVGLAILSLGFHTSGAGVIYPYRVLYEIAPGWEGVRVPARLNTLTSLALALLAAAGAQQLLSRVGRRWAGAAAGLLVALICVEGSGFEAAPRAGGVLGWPSHPSVPPEPVAQRGIEAPQLHLPITIPANRRYVLWSTRDFPKIVNGRGSFDPTFFEQLTRDVYSFPDRRSVAILRGIGVRSVVLHQQAARGTRWHSTAMRSIDGLGVTRAERDGLVVYTLPRPDG
jgi:hypothetical protein